jgi:hypothetical protein
MAKQCLPSTAGDELCPGPSDVVSYHVQLTLSGLLDIPLNKPPKDHIFNSIHEIDVTKLEPITVKQPVGKKVLVVGKFMAGIEYIAKTPDQKVHFTHWDIPFQVLVKDNDGNLLPFDFDLSQYIAHVCVEHVEFQQVDERTIAYEIVLLVWLQRKEN